VKCQNTQRAARPRPAPIISQKAGFKLASDALLQTIIFNVANFIATVIVLLIVDATKRDTLKRRRFPLYSPRLASLYPDPSDQHP